YQKIHAEAAVPVPTDRPGWPVSLSTQVPFVGREQALHDLRLAYHRSGMVVVLGEAGAGKSRLIQELFLSSEPAPRLILAPSRPLENNLPFQPIIELLRHSVTLDDWLRLSPPWASQLSVLLPELVIMRPEIPPVGDLAPEQARAMLFESIRHLIEQIASSQPILFFLDDAQWADEATLATLAYLEERSVFKDRGLLVMAARPEEPNPSLDNLLASAHSSPVFLQVNLESLSESEIGELARHALGQTPSPEFVRRLAQDTGGNPLFLLETLRAVLELSPGPDFSQTPETLPLASSIHLLVRNRLRSLSQNTLQVLVMAAVLGNEFFPLVLEKASRMDPEQVVQALDDLERAHLIRPTHTGSQAEQSYYFIHDKIREVLLLELSPARKRLYHQRAALALQEVLGNQADQQASVLARHLEIAGDTLAAFHYWLTAGQRARQLFSLKEAYAAYRRAEQILQNQGQNVPDHPVHLLYTSWGELAYQVNDRETLPRVYNALLHLGEQRRSRLLTGAALSGMGTVAHLENRPVQGLAYLERAIGYLKQAGDDFEHMQAWIRQGMLYLLLNRRQDAIASFEKALELGEEHQELNFMTARSEAHYQISQVLAKMGWPEKGSAHAELALQQCAWSAHPTSEVRAYMVLGLTHFQTGRYTLAGEYCRRGIELAEQTQNWPAAGQLHVYAGHVDLAIANLDACWEHIKQAISFGQRAGLKQTIADGHSLRGDFYRVMGQPALAAEEYQQAVTGSLDSIEAADSLARLGLVLGMDHQVEIGSSFLAQARATAEAYGLGMVALTARFNQAQIQLMRRTRLEELLEEVEAIEKECLERGMGLMPMMALRTRTMAALLTGQIDLALELSDLALERSQEFRNLWSEIFSLKLRIDVLNAAGQTAEVVATCQEQLSTALERLMARATLPMIQPYVQSFYQNLGKVAV
ncbi:MAG TPA: AAA family ATPase, partial [Anaerolineaceae bacterium]|nr:AAA family ATPase [Anaerolineaceae bacterium]